MFLDANVAFSINGLEITTKSTFDEIITNEEWEHYDVKDVGYPMQVIALPIIYDGDNKISVSIKFYESRITHVLIYDANPKFGDEEWQHKEELIRKLSNE